MKKSPSALGKLPYQFSESWGSFRGLGTDIFSSVPTEGQPVSTSEGWEVLGPLFKGALYINV
jgi:hypothetical protein